MAKGVNNRNLMRINPPVGFGDGLDLLNGGVYSSEVGVNCDRQGPSAIDVLSANVLRRCFCESGPGPVGAGQGWR